MKVKLALGAAMCLAAGLTVAASGCGASATNLTIAPFGEALKALSAAYASACAKPVDDISFVACQKAYTALDTAAAKYTELNDQLKQESH
jgi:hypothetical protein